MRYLKWLNTFFSCYFVLRKYRYVRMTISGYILNPYSLIGRFSMPQKVRTRRGVRGRRSPGIMKTSVSDSFWQEFMDISVPSPLKYLFFRLIVLPTSLIVTVDFGSFAFSFRGSGLVVYCINLKE